MSCARYRAQLSRYLDDELPPRQRSELLAHVAICRECAAALARFRQSEVVLKKLPESKPSDDVRGAVLRATRRRRRAPHGLRGHLVWWLSARGRVSPVVSLGTLGLVVGLTTLVLTVQTFPTLGVSLGFVPPPTPTSSYLDVPASPTPPPGSALTPRLVSSSPFDGERDVPVAQVLTVRFDQAMERRSVERAFRLDPPAPGSFAWDADNELHFTPGAGGLLRGVTYTVALRDGARGLSGATLPPGPLWSFVTRDPPVLLDVSPAPGQRSVVPTATLVLTFSEPMDPASIEAALRLEGASAPGQPWHLRGFVQADPDGRVLRIGPAAPLPAGEVTVILADGARDKAGGALAPATWRFQVAGRKDAILLAGPRLLSLALTANAVTPPVTYMVGPEAGDPAPSRATFSLYALPPDQLVGLLPWLVADRSAPAAGPWPNLDLTSLHLIQTWTSSLPPGRDLSPGGIPGEMVLPVREPGAYLLAAGAPGAGGDQRVVMVSEAGPVFIAAGDHALVWTGDLVAPPATAKGRARVRLFTADGTPLLAGDADSDGLFSATLPPGSLPAVALVERGNVPSLALVDPAAPPAPSGPALAATISTDQSQYAPGDAVRFTAVVPGAADDNGTGGATIQMRLRDPADRILGVLTLKPDRLGAVVGSFALAPGLAAGSYALEVEVGGAVTRWPVPVAPPAAPATLRLQLATPVAEELFAGTVFTPTLLALDGAGTPVPGVVVTLTLLGGVNATAPITGTTDTSGLVRPALRLPLLSGGDAGLRLAAQARDPVGHATTWATSLPVRAGRLALHLALSGRAFTPGSVLTATTEVRDRAGRVVTGQPVTMGLYVLTGRNELTAALSSGPGVTGETGVVTTTLPLPLLGNFVVRAVTTDTTGTLLTAEEPLWVYLAGSPASWAMPPLAVADLVATADQASYAPGTTARLLVQAGTAGRLLVLTSLGGSIRSQQVVTLSANGGLVWVPVPAAPDAATLVVTFLHYVTAADGVRLVRTDLPLAITDPATRLAVDLQLDQPDAVYHPGDSTLIHVRLRDSAGRPQAGQAVLALVPPGSVPPAAPSAGPILAGSTWPGEAALPADPASAAPLAAPPAYWNAGLVTDASGQASVTVPVPDEAGAWQLVTWGFAPGGLTGQATTALAVHSTLDLQWTPPAALVQGDSLRLQAVARNPSTDTVSADVRLTTDGAALHLAGAGLVSLTLGPGETRLLEWRVDAVGAGPARLVLEAGWGPPGAAAAGRSRRAAALAVAPYGSTADQYHAGKLAGDETFHFPLPAEATPAAATLDVRVDPTLGGVLADSLATQLDSGAGQGAPASVAERLTVGVVASRLVRLNQLTPDSLPDNLSAAQALDLAYLYGAQNPDGSWGGWPGGVGDVRTTAAVLQALWLLADEQVQGGSVDVPAVDRGTRDRAVAWLHTAVTPPVSGPGALPAPAPAAAEQRAEAFYVLSLYNSAEREEVRWLIAVSGQLTPAGRGWLALALEQLGSHTEARTLLPGLALPGAPASGTLPGPAATTPPTALDLAVGLQALLTVDPEGQEGHDAARVAAVLLAARQGAIWSAPGTTAAAVQALAAWVPRVPTTSGGAGIKYRVLVNGQLIKEVVMGPRGSGGTLRLLVPGSALKSGDNQVRLVADGDTTLYYSVHLVALLGAPGRPPVGDHAPALAASLLREVTPNSGGRVGATVQVSLTLTLNQEVPGFQVSEPLPGALAAVTNIMFTPPASSGDTAPALLGSSIGAGRILFRLGPLAAGTYYLSYRAQLAAAGTFEVLPAIGTVPGAPDLWVRSVGAS